VYPKQTVNNREFYAQDSIKTIREYPWYVRILFWFQKRKYGAVLESAKFWSRSPRVFLGLSSFFGALERKNSPIHPQLRSLIFIHISKIIQCPFCTDVNSAKFVDRLGNEDLLSELYQFDTSDLFSNKEKATLRYAEAISQTPNRVTDSLFADLKEHFTEDEIVELTALIAFQNCSSRFNTALKIPSQNFYKSRQ
jgi:alkylhydroperoxidase family enzyme